MLQKYILDGELHHVVDLKIGLKGDLYTGYFHLPYQLKAV